MKISILHPSRGRPEKAHQTARNWTDNIGRGVKWDYVLSVDSDDESKYDLLLGAQNMRRITTPNRSVVEATNRAALNCYGDILIYLSDDFACFENWGLAVIKEFEKYSGPTLIKVDDMLQPFHVPVLTIPMMNRELYEKLGYFFHPDFKSMFCDEHLYWVAKKLGALKLAPHLKFEHQHVSVGKAQDDETYRRSAANWDQGKSMFAKHKAAGFPV